MCIFVEPNKSSVLIFSTVDKCLYVKNAGKRPVTYLKCIDYKIGCKCRAKISQEKFSRTNSAMHNHENHGALAEYEIAYAKLKKQAVQSSRSLRELHMETLKSLSLAASGMLSWDNVRNWLNKLRRQSMPACSSIEKFVDLLESDEKVIGEYAKLRDSDFYAGSVASNSCVVFVNRDLIEHLPEHFDMFVDGTFNVAPFHAAQLLIVLAELEGKPRPIVYVIMTNRKQLTYVELFEYLRDAIFLRDDGQVLVPLTFMSDFEKASRSAAKAVWPDIELVGCNFHFCQALRRKAASLTELSRYLNGHSAIYTSLKMFMRLSLLPLNRVEEGLASLDAWLLQENLKDDFQNFRRYFDRVWMKHYPPSSWCVSARLRRTNCNIEGYNNFVKQRMRRNPTAWTFLEALRELSLDASSKLTNDRKKKKTAIDRSRLTEPLQTNLEKLENDEIGIIEFLQVMSQTVPFNQL